MKILMNTIEVKNAKTLILLNDMIADTLSKKKLQPVVT